MSQPKIMPPALLTMSLPASRSTRLVGAHELLEVGEQRVGFDQVLLYMQKQALGFFRFENVIGLIEVVFIEIYSVDNRPI